MDAYNEERRLRDEVIYLHSLWHIGPPPPPPRSSTTFTNSSNIDLHLHQQSRSTQFKRQRPKNRNRRGYWNNRNQDPGKEWPCNPTANNNGAPLPVWPTPSNSKLSWHSVESGKEWPCIPSPDASTHSSAWPAVTTQQNSQQVCLSPQQQARFAAKRAQAKALKAAKCFFRSNNDDDDDDDDDDEDDDLGESDYDDCEIEEDEYPHDSTEEGCGVAKYKFFVKVFADDGELTDYYKKNYHNGEFSCLVCCGFGMKKSSKMYKDCVALVQHSISIGKTKKRRAHRAYGKVICKVLGWNIHKLPTIVSELSGNRDVPSSATESEAQRHVDGSKDDLDVLGHSETGADGVNGDKPEEMNSAVNETRLSNDESIVSQDNSLLIVDTSIGDEGPDLTAPNIVNGEGPGQQSDVVPVVGGEENDVSHDLVRNASAN